MIVMIAVVVVAVMWIRGGGWRTTAKCDVAVHPIDMDVRARPTFSLC